MTARNVPNTPPRPPGEQGTAHDHRRDRPQIEPDSGARIAHAEPAHQVDCGQRDDEAGERIDQHLGQPDRDAGDRRRPLVIADGVDPDAEAGAPEHEAHDHVSRDDEERSPRQEAEEPGIDDVFEEDRHGAGGLLGMEQRRARHDGRCRERHDQGMNAAEGDDPAGERTDRRAEREDGDIGGGEGRRIGPGEGGEQHREEAEQPGKGEVDAARQDHHRLGQRNQRERHQLVLHVCDVEHGDEAVGREHADDEDRRDQSDDRKMDVLKADCAREIRHSVGAQRHPSRRRPPP